MPETAQSGAAGAAFGAHSALAFRIRAAGAPAAGKSHTLILLPAAPGCDEELLQAIRASGWQAKVITLLPPRAIYNGEQLCGFTWFYALAPTAIEPTSFEDSLWHLERFVLDLLQAGARPDELVLIGAGEGARLLEAAVPYLHDRIAAALTLVAGRWRPVSRTQWPEGLARGDLDG